MTDSRQYVLLVDDDSSITEALSYTLDREGRTLVLCSDVEAAEVALASFPITHLVSDVQFSGDFGFEGLHFLGRVKAMRPDCRITLITGYATEALCSAAFRHGASMVLSKPFDTLELEAALDPAGATMVSTAPFEIIRIPSIDEILQGDSLAAAFQPIVRMTDAGPMTIAYEALTRVRGSWLTGGPVMLFDYAARRDRLADLNVATMRRALEASAELPAEASLFINIDPLTFQNPALVPTLFATAAKFKVSLDRLVIEVTERSAFADDDVAGQAFDELRAAGVRFALDDHGSAYSHLAQISRIRPSFIKISNEFGTGFEKDETKQRIVRHTVALARDFGCETILEGIETAATALAAAEAGVTLAQGFHYGRPSAASHWVLPTSVPAVLAPSAGKSALQAA
jgi:EAL domain-containing protein (putative c-di-GMP-specific phosphodiesterase class I)/ActR/RegA family two-component response regulator